jgi:hypothetical protein
MRRGRQPSRRAGSNAAREYHPICRSAAPMLSIRVLTSTTSRHSLPGWKARTSIQPWDRPSTTSASCFVCQPPARSLRSMAAIQRAWTRSRWCRSMVIGPRRARCASTPSALTIASTTSTLGLALPASMAARYPRAIPASVATAAWVRRRSCRVRRIARATSRTSLDGSPDINAVNSRCLGGGLAAASDAAWMQALPQRFGPQIFAVAVPRPPTKQPALAPVCARIETARISRLHPWRCRVAAESKALP